MLGDNGSFFERFISRSATRGFFGVNPLPILRRLTNRLGLRISLVSNALAEFEDGFREVYKRCEPFTSTSIERLYALYKSVQYIVDAGVPGDLVECGVWKGGSCMVMAETLRRKGDTSRRIFLYDTYAGMAEPTSEDYLTTTGRLAEPDWNRNQKMDHNAWCHSPLEEVKKNLRSTGYPEDGLVFVQGRVEETIPKVAPENIALLRLDTDWYESTKHELLNLYPLLAERGVLIVDDYGTWAGARKAVDEYMSANGISMMLNRID
jgi:O-methyltransferase